MNLVLRAAACLSLTTPFAAAAQAIPDALDVPPLPTEAVSRVAAWVAASGDNHALPYAIIDKRGAALFLFDAKGKASPGVPVLLGIAPGDEATPGVGAKKLAEIGPAEKTTPSGRFLAKFGVPFRRERVLWVDYATSVAIHPIPSDAAKAEKRRERMLSPTPEDNRITFGCINVPRAFYANTLRPRFLRKGGYVYILPDAKSLEEAFPRVHAYELGRGLASRKTPRHPGLDPGSRYTSRLSRKEAGPRIKSGATVRDHTLAPRYGTTVTKR